MSEGDVWLSQVVLFGRRWSAWFAHWNAFPTSLAECLVLLWWCLMAGEGDFWLSRVVFFWEALISVSCSWLGPRCIDWSAHWGVRTSGPDKTLLETVENKIIIHRSKYECVYTRCIIHVIQHVQVTWKYRSTYARILQHFTYVAPTAVYDFSDIRLMSTSIHCCLQFLVL